MNVLRYQFVAGIILCSFLGAANASDDPAILIGKAATIYDEARDLSGDDRTRKLREVDDLLSRIEREHPDNVLAAFIAEGRSVGSIDVAALRAELAQDTRTVSAAGPTEIENAHKRLAAARGLKERLSLSRDLAELLHAYGQVERLTSLASRSDYFDDLLRDARIDLNTVGAEVVAGVYVDVFIEQPLAEALGEYMPQNIAASTASTIATMAEAIVSGGAVMPGYVFDQVALIVEASISLAETNSELVAQVYSGTLSTVQALVEGDLSPEIALEQFDFTLRLAEDYVGTLSYPSSRDAARRMWIIAQLARLKVQEGPRVGPARTPSELLATRLRILEMDAGETQQAVLSRDDYRRMADDVALAFGLRSWPDDWRDATRARALGESSARLRWLDERAAADAAPETTVSDTPVPEAAPGPYWQESSRSTAVFVSGESMDGFTIHSDHRVTWNGIEALPAIASINPTNATAHVSPDGASAVVFQTYFPSDLGWRERLSVVFADPGRPPFVLRADDVFRFGRGSLWSSDGAFLASTYDFDEFENDLLVVNLVTREYYRVASDRPAEQVSAVRLDSLRTSDDGVHRVEFGHLACPGGGADCGMALIADAGTSEVRFRLPEVPAAPAPGGASADGAGPLTGIWSGTTTAGARTFDYRWEIDQAGEAVSGIIELKTQAAADWSRYRFEGQFTDGVLTYRGTSWITSSNGNFCMATGRLTLSESGGLMSLNGRWGGNPVPGGCPSSASGGVSISKRTADAGAEPGNAREEGESERAGAASNAAPPGTLWVQVASRSDLEEARAFARTVGGGARIFRASNGWFAITAALLNEPEYAEGIAGLVAANGWPSDSILTRGEAFLEELPVNPGAPAAAAFTETSAGRDTRILARSWRDGVPTYETVGMAAAGEAVTVFGAPDERGDCLVSPNEGIFVKCADLAAFGTTPEPDLASDAVFSVVVLDRAVSWSEARQMAEDMGGHLATLNTPERQSRVWDAVRQRPESWVRNSSGYLIGPWLGGFQSPGSAEPGGGWQWVSGSPFSYENWIKDTSAGGLQPNNTSGIEDALVFMGYGAMAPGWNDYPSAPTGSGWQAQIRAFVLERTAGGAGLAGGSAANDDATRNESLEALRERAAAVALTYGGARDTMRLVAENADHAALASIVYADDLRVGQWVHAGRWRVVETFEEDVWGGLFTAALFESADGDQVLAFRGTDSGSDWINNLGAPLGIMQGQSSEASRLVDRLSDREGYPRLTFVGHSLGGRLAQVAAARANGKAAVFDSSPLSTGETLLLMTSDARIASFRSDDDLVSGLSARRDIEVMNYPTYEHGLVKGLIDRAIVEHDHRLMALAMQEVQMLLPYLD